MIDKTYALINKGIVQQVLSTEGDISTMFAPGLKWVPVAAGTDVAPGFVYDGAKFSAAVPPSGADPVMSVAAVESQLAILQGAVARIAAAQTSAS